MIPGVVAANLPLLRSVWDAMRRGWRGPVEKRADWPAVNDAQLTDGGGGNGKPVGTTGVPLPKRPK